MSDLAFLQRNILEVGSAIAEYERAIVENAPSPALLSTLDSLQQQHAALEEEFRSEASARGIDVCAYTLLTEHAASPDAAGVGRVLDKFQGLVSLVHGVLKQGRPRARGRIPADIAEATSFKFGYTYAGSLGIVLTLENERLLLGDSKLDDSLNMVFAMAKASSSQEVAAFAARLGPAAVRLLYRWTSEHLSGDIGADIRWIRAGEIRHRVLVQPAEFRNLRTAIESTGEERTDRIALPAMLVGFDVQRRTFRAAFDAGGYVRGRLSENLVLHEPARVPHRYTLDVSKTTTTNYATEADTVSWELQALVPEGQPEGAASGERPLRS